MLDPALDALSNAKAPEWLPCGNVGPSQLAACTFPSTRAGVPAKSLVVIGDSFAISWLPAIRATQSEGYTVYALTYGQCPAADVSVEEGVGAAKNFTARCDQHRDWAVQQVERLKPAVVVLASQDSTVTRLSGGASGTAALDRWEAGTAAMMARVKAAGATRVVLLAAPPQTASLTACAPSRSSDPENCVRQVTTQWHQVADVERSASRAQNADYLDTRLLFCATNDYCPAFVGSMPVKVDGAHLTGAYSASLGPILAPLITG